HKFVFFAERFGRPACVGCGRCLRACGVGESLVRVLQHVERAARAAAGVPTEAPARRPDAYL
ncbi:4Fe-4S dicluster domain-containing protein, partial [Planctomycetota bacterium]